ncbi:hypothetical protein [Falsiroseomonas sp. HW251]|uniref:hypothetical protein n=1 Tax=Falsiroseomonas sp. HW251 TaxID=3390998 RepID=UPI003D31F0E3
MPLHRALRYAVYTVWVSLCAFAPELIWQGFVLMHGHFGIADAASALFIGALFAFFVEPLAERLKAGHWRLETEQRHGLLFSAALSVGFGFVVVCLHEAIAAYLGGGHAGDDEHRVSLARALDATLEWAAIPAAVTAAWFVAGSWRRAAVPAVALVGAWTVATGIHFDWGWPVTLTSAVPCTLLAGLGARIALRRWDASTFPALARLTAWVTGGWLVFAWAADAVATSLGGARLDFYASDALDDDLRFYLGWTLGLFVAPDPIVED